MGDAAEMPRCMELIGSNQKPRAGFDDVGRGTLVERGGAGARQCDVQTTDRLALVGETVSAHALAFVGQCDPEIAQVLQDRLLLRVRGGLNCPLAVRRLFPRVYPGHRRLRCAGISRAWNFCSAGSPARCKKTSVGPFLWGTLGRVSRWRPWGVVLACRVPLIFAAKPTSVSVSPPSRPMRRP